jgi:hypothetical protein
MYEVKPMRIITDFSAETLKDKRGWNVILFQALKENN